jgi:hypothetical protein
VGGFRNSPPIEPLIFLSCIFLSSQPAIRKENSGKENESRSLTLAAVHLFVYVVPRRKIPATT